MNENDKVDTNLLSSLNQDNYDKTYGVTEPKGINVDASFYTSQTLNTFDKIVGVKTPRCKVVYVITKGTTDAGPQVGSTPWTRRQANSTSNINMKVYQAKVICPNAGSDLIPYPINASQPKQNELDLLKMKLHTTAFMEYDATKNQVLPERYDEVVIEYIGNDKSEAKILEVYRKDTPTPQENETSPTQAFNNSNGGTLADASNNTTGDVVQNKTVNLNSTNTCGDGSAQYPYVECKKAKLDANGQMASLHPVYWDKINNLLNEIKTRTSYTIRIGETIRSKESQLAARKRRCPAALQKKGEEWLKTAKWSDVLANGPCSDATPTGAVEGPWASNHLKGLAVDFVMDVGCPARNVNRASYDRCRSVSRVFNYLNSYASKYGVNNLISEPWHWSHNGG
jgi:hypothetical protein